MTLQSKKAVVAVILLLIQLKAIVEADHKNYWKNCRAWFNPLKAIGKTKKLAKWVLHEQNRKDWRYEICWVFSLHHKKYTFLSRNEKWIFFIKLLLSKLWQTKNYFPKVSLHPEEIVVTVWLIHYSFLNPDKTIDAA